MIETILFGAAYLAVVGVFLFGTGVMNPNR